jgi:hypothetical protein
MLSLTALSSAMGIASIDGLELPEAVAIRLLVYESNASRVNDTIFPAWSFVMFHHNWITISDFMRRLSTSRGLSAIDADDVLLDMALSSACLTLMDFISISASLRPYPIEVNTPPIFDIT